MKTCSTGCRIGPTACPTPWGYDDRRSNTRSGPPRPRAKVPDHLGRHERLVRGRLPPLVRTLSALARGCGVRTRDANAYAARREASACSMDLAGEIRWFAGSTMKGDISSLKQAAE